MSCTALIILIFNNKDNIVNLIESVERYNTAPIKYIIIDNGSTALGITENISNFFEAKICG